MRKLLFLLVLCVSLVGRGEKVQVDLSHPINLIIDTDASVDGMMAMLYLLKSSRIDVKAIVVGGTGMSRIEYGTRNISNLM